MATTDPLEVEPGLRKAAFLSHSSADAQLVGTLCRSLESRGIGCWIAPRDVTPSRPYAEEIVRGIESTGSLVLLASAQAISSVQVLSEVEQAHKRKKDIYTVLVGDKPRIGRELDFYISRLHWIESGNLSAEHLADRLAEVLSGRKKWEDVAPGPSLRRTVLYRRDAFQGAALATLLVLLVAGGGLYYWVNRSLNLDYRRLGHVTLAVQPGESANSGRGSLRIRALVWLQAAGVRFSDLSLLTAAHRSDGSVDRSTPVAWPIPEQVGSVEFVDFSVPQTTNGLTTCLTVPSPGLHDRYRVTQAFAVRTSGTGARDELAVSPVAEAKVSRENGLPCGTPD
jgi:TIR domain